jgi:Na+/H+-translocating membrane pyrophosphatase
MSDDFPSSTSLSGFESAWLQDITPFLSTILALIGGLFSLIAATGFYMEIMRIPVYEQEFPYTTDIANAIYKGTMTFLATQYLYVGGCVLILAICVGILLSWQTATCFLFGAALSALCGLIGLHTSTQANVRTALACINPINAVHAGMVIAFKSGAVMSMSVVTSVLWGVTLTFLLLRSTISMEDFSQHISGFAFGVSVVALFARVGGGVFAKAADVGADIMGKFEEGLDEDDPNNPATIADNVGDNVGDVAGVGADLFESFASSLIAAAILGHVEFGFPGVALPFWVAGVGTWGSVIGCLVIIYGGNAHSLSNLSLADDLADQRPLLPHRDDARGNDDDSDLPSHDYNAYGSWGLLTAGERDVQATHLVAQSERVQHALLAIVRKGAFAALLLTALGSALSVGATFGPAHPKAWAFFGCIVAGLVVGSLLAYITEFCTAYSCAPTRSVALQVLIWVIFLVCMYRSKSV